MKKIGKKTGRIAKDVCIYFVIAYGFYRLFIVPENFSDPNVAARILANLTTYVIAVGGLFGLMAANHFDSILPDSFKAGMRKTLKKIAQEIVFEVIDSQSHNISEHDFQKLRREVHELLGDAGCPEVHRMDVISAQNSGLAGIEDAKCKLETLLFKSGIISDLREDPEAHTTPGLNYFIRLFDLMYDEDNAKTIISSMITFISHTLDSEGKFSQKNLNSIDVVVTPNNGNYLLGYQVSKELRKWTTPHIKMIAREKIVGNNYYEGTIPKSVLERGPRMIIVHDVLATGKQIVESIEEIRKCIPNSKIIGVFSLVYRVDGEAKKQIVEDLKVKMYNLIEYTEAQIENHLTSSD